MASTLDKKFNLERQLHEHKILKKIKINFISLKFVTLLIPLEKGTVYFT